MCLHEIWREHEHQNNINIQTCEFSPWETQHLRMEALLKHM